MKRRYWVIVVLILLSAIAGVFFFKPSRVSHEVVVGVPNNSATDSKNSEGAPALIVPEQTVLQVSFTSQAPFAEWSDPLQQSACEEASMLMAYYWLQNDSSITIDKQQALDQIQALNAYEQQNLGVAHDLAAADTAKIFKDYFKLQTQPEVKYNLNADQMVAELAQGHLLLVPVNGQKLGNPHFQQPGPERHMLVIKGYDNYAQEFITNDPGTRVGQDYRYKYSTLIDAMRDYLTGEDLPIKEIRKVAIIIAKQG